MQAISAKELRTKFPFVKSELEKGTSFLIIYNSKLIGKLIPAGALLSSSQEIDPDLELWQKAAAEDINKFLPPITKKEHEYYMSLPPYKE